MKSCFGMVTFAEILDPFRFHVRFVLTGNVIGNKINDYLQIGLVRTSHKRLKFSHSIANIHGQIGIDIIVVLDGVGRTRDAFDHVRIVFGNAVRRKIGHGGMFNHSRVPHVRNAEIFERCKRFVGNVIELTNAVFVAGSVKFVGGI